MQETIGGLSLQYTLTCWTKMLSTHWHQEIPCQELSHRMQSLNPQLSSYSKSLIGTKYLTLHNVVSAYEGKKTLIFVSPCKDKGLKNTEFLSLMVPVESQFTLSIILSFPSSHPFFLLLCSFFLS